jgi:hypothetical protein
MINSRKSMVVVVAGSTSQQDGTIVEKGLDGLVKYTLRLVDHLGFVQDESLDWKIQLSPELGM